MNETIKVSLTYDSKAKESDIRNDAMLFALGLEFEARKYNVKFACNSEPKTHKLDMVLSGNPDSVSKFLDTLRSKKLDYTGVDDYNVGERQPYKGKEPDWEYHDSIVAMRASYLRTAYMTDVRELLEKLANHPKLEKISA